MRSSRRGAAETNLTRNHELQVRYLASHSGLRIRYCRELWCRSQTWLGSLLLWLWCRPAGTTLIGPLDLKLSYALGAALKKN